MGSLEKQLGHVRLPALLARAMPRGPAAPQSSGRGKTPQSRQRCAIPVQYGPKPVGARRCLTLGIPSRARFALECRSCTEVAGSRPDISVSGSPREQEQLIKALDLRRADGHGDARIPLRRREANVFIAGGRAGMNEIQFQLRPRRAKEDRKETVVP